MKNLVFIGCLLCLNITLYGQGLNKWPKGKQSVIVLTYDDALTSHLNVAIPQLDKANLKGTFFLKEPASVQDISGWKNASKKGHELANHTIFHPCHSSRFKADPHYHIENYTTENLLREIAAMNKNLTALDNKSMHTYAYPCGETTVGGKSYVDTLRKSGFVKYARAIESSPIITDFSSLDVFRVPSKAFKNDVDPQEVIDFVKQVQKSKGMGVLLFHGVGGDYLEISAEAHQKLVDYLKNNSDIWVATFEEALDYVTKK